MTETIRVGVIGAGGRGRLAHAKPLTELEGVEVVGVAELDRERREEFIAEFGCKGYEDYHEMLEAGLDAVTIATPNFVRKEPVIAAAQAGKHIMCEKPMALSVKDAQAMVAAVEKAGVKMGICFSLHFYPPHHALVKTFHSGQLGDLVYCWYRDFHRTKPPRPDAPKPKKKSWRADPELSGRLIHEYSCHRVNWMEWVGGPVAKIAGTMVEREGPTLWNCFEDADVAIFHFQKGGVGLMEVLRSTVMEEAGTVAIIGTKKGVTIRDDRLLIYSPGEETPQEIEPPPCIGEMEDFIQAIREDREPESNAQAGLRTVVMCEAIRQGRAQGIEVKV